MFLEIAVILIFWKFSVCSAIPICKNEFPWNLDIPSFYWAKPTPNGTALMWTKSCTTLNVMSPYFNPAKKTLLMVHGLQPECVLNEDQFGLNGELDQVLLPYISMGYNVGVFLWTQFADEEIINFVWSEDQIYTTSSFVKMRYKVKTSSGAIISREAPLDMSITDYFIRSWIFHWPLGTSPEVVPEIRVMGHSLGTQLTLNSAYHIYMRTDITVKPDRLALLDAVMSPSNKVFYRRRGGGCGKTISANMGCMARELTREANIAIEYYKSSFINRCIFSSREDKDLIEYTAFSVLRMGQWGDHPLGSCWDRRLLPNLKRAKSYIHDLAYQMTAQHIYVVPYYLLSLYQPPHQCLLSEDGTVCTPIRSLALSAAMSTEDVLIYAKPPLNNTEPKLCFHQFKDKIGTMTLSPADDYFYLKDCKDANT